MNQFEGNRYMNFLHSYADDGNMDWRSWEEDDAFYSSYEFLRRDKIVELKDTGCDARSPGQCTKNKLNNLNDIKNPEVFDGNNKVSKVGLKDQIPKIHGTKYSAFKEDLNKNSLLSLAVSNSTFVVSDQETRRRPTTDFEDFFADFDDINQRPTEGHYRSLRDELLYDYERDIIHNRRKFIDRAVDSDCLSDSSECAIEKETSDSEIHTKLKDREKKVSNDSSFLKSETKTKRITRTKLLNKSADPANEGIYPANEYRFNNIRFTPKTISSPAKNLKNRQASQSKSDTLQGRQKFGATSRTIVKKKNLKVTKPDSEILKPLKSSFKDDEKDNNVVKKVSFKGSKLPVWQGWHKKSKALLNVNTPKKQKEINIKEFDDKNYVIARNSPENSENKCEDVEITNINKTEELIEENTEKLTLEKVKGCLKRSKFEDPVEDSAADLVNLKSEAFFEPRKKAEKFIIENCPDDEQIMKHEEDANVKAVEGYEISAGNIQSKEIKWKNESPSELWTESCEKAYARGRAIGLKLHRMVKAAREKRERELAK